jgi:serine/threonine-protein kinase
MRKITVTPFDGSPDPAIVATSDELDDFLYPGQLLQGIYRLRRRVGAGAMGEVWEAQDECLFRTVAIKTSRPGDLDTLFQEGQALAAVRHPAVPAVHAMGSLGMMPFLVMERVAGRSLEQLLVQRRQDGDSFPVPEVVEMLQALADGLDAIHSAGLSHRDIKPANILVGPRQRLVFVDFGIVVPECRSGRGESLISGTPYYMAPEVIAGRVRCGEGRLADLYALGVLAFELLTLEPPFVAGTAMEVLRQHMYEPAPRVGRLRQDTPEALDALITSLLAKDPAERPQTAHEVGAALARMGRQRG